MVRLEGFRPDHELDVLLVADGLIQAAEVAYSPAFHEGIYNVLPGEDFDVLMRADAQPIADRVHALHLREANLLELKDRLNDLGLTSEFGPEESKMYKTDTGRKLTVYEQPILVADSERTYVILTGDISPPERKMLMGWPHESAHSYNGQSNLRYVESVVAARDAGIEMPPWLPFVLHVPARMDIVEGDVSLSSVSLAERIREHTTSKYPELAIRLEDRFRHVFGFEQ